MSNSNIEDNSEVEKIIEYWNERASRYGLTGEATLLDNNMRMLEVQTVISWLNANDTVLEVGCANGVSTLQYANHCAFIEGLDLSEKMIENANLLLRNQRPAPKNIRFKLANVLALNYPPGIFDTVVSVRCLINLPSWELQQKAILNIWNLLPEKGKFIFVEGTKDGLQKINELRSQLSLEPINSPWYDNYFSEERTIEFLEDHFETYAIKNLDVYFLISRVLYPFACLPDEPNFDNISNSVARLLTQYVIADIGTSLLISRCLIKK